VAKIQHHFGGATLSQTPGMVNKENHGWGAQDASSEPRGKLKEGCHQEPQAENWVGQGSSTERPSCVRTGCEREARDEGGSRSVELRAVLSEHSGCQDQLVPPPSPPCTGV
jgi:hypothetical protein